MRHSLVLLCRPQGCDPERLSVSFTAVEALTRATPTENEGF